MGLFTRIGRQARAEGAGLNYMLEKDAFRAAGYNKLPGDATYADPFNNKDRLELGTADLDAGRGAVHQYLKREYGMGDETAAHIVAAGRNDVADIPRPENAKHFRGVGQQQVAPGSASTQIKIKSPTQAEQVAAGNASVNKLAKNHSFFQPDKNAGLTTNFKQKIGLETDNAKALAGDFRKDATGAKNFIEGYRPPNTEQVINQKAQANALAKAEIDAVKRSMGITDTAEAIQIANVNRANNENYNNVLLENSNYVKARLDAGDAQLGQQLENAANALNNNEMKYDDMNSMYQGILRGGVKYQDAPQSSRMAGDSLGKAIGAGSFADVYPGEAGQVIKMQPEVVNFRGTLMGNKAVQEADFTEAAAELGIGPYVDYVDINPDGSTTIAMQDMRGDYEPLNNTRTQIESRLNDTSRSMDERISAAKQKMDIPLQANRQLAELAEKGIGVDDRHGGNILVNKKDGSVMQLDFGPEQNSPVEGMNGVQGAYRFEDDSQKAFYMSQKTSKAMIAAGFRDEGMILDDTVNGLLDEGKVNEALDVARQGLAIVQGYDGPSGAPAIARMPQVRAQDGSLSDYAYDNLYDTSTFYS